MDRIEKAAFLSQKIKELNAITTDIEESFPEKSFKLDGILVGNIVELLVAEAFGIELFRQSEKTHDGRVVSNGRLVQIKGTQKMDAIVIREVPDYLIVAFLDKENGTIKEIFNGPGALAWEYRTFVPSMNFYTIRVNKLLELNQTVPDAERLKSIIPIERLAKNAGSSNDYPGMTKEKKNVAGRATEKGYISPKNQENLGCLGKPGTHPNQRAYLLRCNYCGHEYEANGCDIAIRNCPCCMEGK